MDLFSLKWITCFWQTALTSKPSIWQICLHSKVELSLTTGWKIKPKKLTFSWLKVNFLGLNFQPVVRLSSTFECGQICQIDGLFAKAVCRKQVIHLSEKRSTWARIFCTHLGRGLFVNWCGSQSFNGSCLTSLHLLKLFLSYGYLQRIFEFVHGLIDTRWGSMIYLQLL